MSKIKYVKIDTTNTSDSNDAFEIICKTFLERKPADMKKEVLKFKNHDLNRKVDLFQLIDFCKKKNVSMEFTFLWRDGTVQEDDSVKLEDQPGFVPAPDNVSVLESERELISNPNLAAEVNTPIAPIIPPPSFNDLPEMDPAQLPD